MKCFLLLASMLVFTTSCSEKDEAPPRREYPLSSKVKPCDDFYDHVCSEVEKSFTLPGDRARYSFAFSDAAERILEEKKAYFKELADKQVSEKRELQLKNYYSACIDKKAVKKSELEHLRSLEEQLAKIETKEQFTKFLFEQYEKGSFSPISIEAFANPSDPKKLDALIAVDAVTLPDPSFYKKKELVKEKRDLIREYFGIIKKEKGENKESLAEDAWDFERAIGAVFPDKKELRQLIVVNTARSKEEFAKLYGNLGLESYLEKVPDGVNIRDFMPKAMAKLNELVGSSSLDELKNAYLYYAFFDRLDQSSPEFSAKRYAFEAKYLGAANERPSRDEECIENMKARFGREIDYYVIERMFPNFPEEKILDLVKSVRATIVATLKRNDWLSESAKKEAINKIQSAPLFVVKPKTEKQWNFNYVADYSKDDFLGNTQVFKSNLDKKMFAELSEEIDFTRWDMPPLEINAFYEPTKNRFMLLQGILQYPFFAEDMEDREVIAGMGMVIGHELGHSIDDNGSRFDSQGRLRQWLTPADKAKFDELTKPLVARFDAVGHDGKMTLGENIGDLVGLSAAYDTAFPNGYSDKLKKEHKQFFAAYGRIWCEVQTDSMRELRLKSDYHSLGRQRVNLQVMNQPGFQKAFSCKEGDKMYLSDDKMISVW